MKNIFEANQNSSVILNKKTDITSLQHCIKWNYCLLARGVFMLNYENLLDPKLSIEVGAGFTYRDLLYETSKATYFLGNGFKPNVRFALEAGVRFYPQEQDDFEGIYLSPMISYRSYSFSVDNNSSQYTYPTLPGFNLGYRFTDLQLKFGYQYESGAMDIDVLSDFYFGVALRNVTTSYYKEDKTGSSLTLIPITKKTSFPTLLIGCKLAIPF